MTIVIMTFGNDENGIHHNETLYDTQHKYLEEIKQRITTISKMTQHKNTKVNTQHNNTQHEDFHHNYIKYSRILHNGTQHNYTQDNDSIITISNDDFNNYQVEKYSV